MFPVVFLLVCFLSCSVSEDPQMQNVAAHPGGDVTLSCQAPNNVTIAAVRWTRSGRDRHVYMKIDVHLVTAHQDPSYVNRVQLKDDEMKNGDLSLILKNVTNNDNGTYECLYVEKTGGGAGQIKLISIVQLDVRGEEDARNKSSSTDVDPGAGGCSAWIWNIFCGNSDSYCDCFWFSWFCDLQEA